MNEKIVDNAKTVVFVAVAAYAVHGLYTATKGVIKENKRKRNANKEN